MKIFIDPGHGGNDPGAIGARGTRESDVVLMAGLALKKIFEEAGQEVVMSRKSDTGVSLASRAELANAAEADLFISIHCNGFTNTGAKGTEVYSYMGDEQGEGLSKTVLTEICGALGTLNRGAKKENFAVLRLTNMTSILIETAFITNSAEESMMMEDGFDEKLANAIAKGVFSHFNIPFQKQTPEHWGKKHLENLVSKGIINSPEMWSDFEKSPTNAMIMALIDKITEVN